MDRSSRLGLTALFAVAAFCFVARQSVGAEMDKVKVAFPSPIVGFAAEFLSEDLFYKELGLDVTSMEIAGIGSINAVISGSIDFSFSSGGSLTRAAAHGQRLLAIATMGNQSGEFAVIRKDIADAAHFDPKGSVKERAQILKGRTFGIGGVNTIGDAYLRVFANAGGVDTKDIVFASLQPPEILAAMKRKALDGFSLGAPWAQQVVDDGSAVMIANGVAGDPPGYSPQASALLVTRPQMCMEHRSICERMGKAMKLAANYMHEHPKESVELLKKRFPAIDARVLADAFESVVSMTGQPPAPSAIQFKNGDRMNLDAGFIKAEDMLPSYEGLFTDEFVK
jgi:ABC-type nitrate/sulfonate/bicarbonate transport system substrate-binding protein